MLAVVPGSRLREAGIANSERNGAVTGARRQAFPDTQPLQHSADTTVSGGADRAGSRPLHYRRIFSGVTCLAGKEQWPNGELSRIFGPGIIVRKDEDTL